MSVLNGSIQLRGQTTAAWAADTTPLLARQPGIDTDTGELRLGNGTDLWADLPTPNALQVALFLFANYVSQPLGIASLNGSGTVPAAELPIDTDPTFSTATNSEVPSALAVKTLVDDRVAAIDWKDAVRVRTTANITLSGTQTIDGVALSAGDRVLVMDQTTATQNGLYVVAAGAWSRSDDASTGDELAWSTVTVMEGTVHANTRWTCNTYPITLGSTNVSWTSFGGGAYTADASTLELVGSQFRVKDDGIVAAKLAHAVLKAIAGIGGTPAAGQMARMTSASAAALIDVSDQSADLFGYTTVGQWLAALGATYNQYTPASANFTVTTGARGQVHAVTTGSSTITATLPSAVTAGNGFTVVLRKVDTGSGTVVTSPATRTLLHEGDYMLLMSDGTDWQVVQEPSPTIHVMYLGPTANAQWTDMPSALAFMYNLSRAARTDLTGRRMVRLTATVHTAGHTTAKLILRYRTAYSTTASDYLDMTTECSVSIAATGGVASAWIALPSGAKGDVYLTVLGSGGNGTADPLFSSVNIELH